MRSVISTFQSARAPRSGCPSERRLHLSLDETTPARSAKKVPRHAEQQDNRDDSRAEALADRRR
jgi:hypothetical protein